MSANTPPSASAMLDKAVIAAGLPAGTTIWSNLAYGILAAYHAFDNNTTPTLANYDVIASIYAFESVSDARVRERKISPASESKTPKKDPKPNSSLPGYKLFGFSACAQDLTHNIIVLRGTRTTEEVGYDLDGWGTNTACKLPSSNPTQTYGNVKENFYDFYTDTDGGLVDSLASSFNSAVSQVAAKNPNKPWFIGAHSLGGALATLGALDAYISSSYGGSTLKPWLATFGSLHVGDQSFANAFNPIVPQTFRFANLCDFVPSLVSLEPDTPTDPYVHVGGEFTFVWQTWDDWGNHSMENIYLPTILNYMSVIKYGPREYPQ
jgi:hypothetical protein